MGCNRKTFSCVQAFGLWRKPDRYLPDCCLNNLGLMLKELATVFNKNDLHYWLDWGSLLGVVREGKLIRHDADLDFGVFVEDLPKINDLAAKVNGLGYDYRVSGGEGYHGMVEAPHPRIYFSKTNRLFADICVWGPLPNDYVNLIYHNAEKTLIHKGPRKFYENLSSIEFEGVNIKVPNNTNLYLEMRYGPGWTYSDPFFYQNNGRELRNKHAATMDFSKLWQ